MKTAFTLLLALLIGQGDTVTDHDRELLWTIHHVGIYCGHGGPPPAGWVRIARVLVPVGKPDGGGCTHDLYVDPARLGKIYWPAGWETMVIEPVKRDGHGRQP